ncbi:MAG: hypothetical protein ACT4PM_09920 [Gemmatimonadales bacterium]
MDAAHRANRCNLGNLWFKNSILVSAALAVWLLGCGRAPVLGEFTYARPYAGEGALRAQIEMGAGHLTVGQARPEDLATLALRYDALRSRPIGTLDPEGVLRLGTERIGQGDNGDGGFRIGRGRRPQEARVTLSDRPELDLEVRLGAGEASLELGGLRLAALTVTAGAGPATLGFAEPNPGQCRLGSVTLGAGTVEVVRAGNSGCAEWRFDGGLGKVTLDLSGAWPAGARIRLNQAVGAVTLRAPRDLGLRVRVDGFLAGFDGEGFTKAGPFHTSAGYEGASRKLDVEVSAAVGGVRVEWW